MTIFDQVREGLYACDECFGEGLKVVSRGSSMGIIGFIMVFFWQDVRTCEACKGSGKTKPFKRSYGIMDIVNELFLNPLWGERRIIPRVRCKSGLESSIQASNTHYCTPRGTLAVPAYTHFEVGFPSKFVSDLMPYVVDNHSPTETVYAWVPREVLEKIIDENGGWAE